MKVMFSSSECALIMRSHRPSGLSCAFSLSLYSYRVFRYLYLFAYLFFVARQEEIVFSSPFLSHSRGEFRLRESHGDCSSLSGIHNRFHQLHRALLTLCHTREENALSRQRQIERRVTAVSLGSSSYLFFTVVFFFFSAESCLCLLSPSLFSSLTLQSSKAYESLIPADQPTRIHLSLVYHSAFSFSLSIDSFVSVSCFLFSSSALLLFLPSFQRGYSYLDGSSERPDAWESLELAVS